MDNKSTVTNNVPMILLFAHLVYSHFVGLDVSKALVAVFLIGLHAFYKHLQSKELPDIRKEVEAKLNQMDEAHKAKIAQIEKEHKDKIIQLEQNQEILQRSFKSESSKYEALLMKVPQGKIPAVLNNMRF